MANEYVVVQVCVTIPRSSEKLEEFMRNLREFARSQTTRDQGRGHGWDVDYQTSWPVEEES